MKSREILKLIMKKYILHSKRFSWYTVICLFFIIWGFVDLLFFQSTHGASTNMMVIFLYIPLTVGMNMSALEISKINYLVPKSEEERKKIKCYEAIVIFVISTIFSIVVGVIVCLINLKIGIYCAYMYLTIGIPVTIAMSLSGFGLYYKKGDKRKKKKNLYVMKIGSGIIAGIGLLYLSVFMLRTNSYFIRNIVAAVALLGSLVYGIYYAMRIKKLGFGYDDINKDFVNLYKQTGYQNS